MNRRRDGFTVMETIVALAVLATASVLVAQTATWAIAERSRTEDRLVAIEAAANVLEGARARPWADLTPEWAESVKPSADITARLPDAALTVRIEPEHDRDRVKRVTVELTWLGRNAKPAPPVSLVGLFADRSAGGGS
jgi:prepilin-type N-terminal cleavage/methylation domain-containing protein